MDALDIFAVVWLLLGVITGYKTGFLYKMATLIGYFVGVFIGSRIIAFMAGVAPFSSGILWSVFFFFFTIIQQLCGIIAWLLDRTFGWIPFVGTANRLLGAALGFLVSAFVLSVMIWVGVELAPETQFAADAQASGLLSWLLSFSSVYEPLMPDSLKNIQL